MVDFFLEHIAPRFAYFIALSLAVGILLAILVGRFRSRLGPVERRRFLMIEVAVYALLLAAMGVFWVKGVTS